MLTSARFIFFVFFFLLFPSFKAGMRLAWCSGTPTCETAAPTCTVTSLVTLRRAMMLCKRPARTIRPYTNLAIDQHALSWLLKAPSPIDIITFCVRMRAGVSHRSSREKTVAVALIMNCVLAPCCNTDHAEGRRLSTFRSKPAKPHAQNKTATAFASKTTNPNQTMLGFAT